MIQKLVAGENWVCSMSCRYLAFVTHMLCCVCAFCMARVQKIGVNYLFVCGYKIL